MNETISFEVSSKRYITAIKMPREAVLSVHRFEGIRVQYARFIRYDTHTDSGFAELTFYCANGDFTYEIRDTDRQFMYLTLKGDPL